MEDAAIVELFLDRDETALTCTSEKYGARLRALAQGITGDRQTAEECENDCYLRAWNAIPPHEPRDYLYAFLARITRRLALNRCRERDSLKRRAFVTELSVELEQCLPAESGKTMEEDLALQEVLNGFLASLDAEKRNVFLRRYWFMDSIASIADRFDLSESKVKTMLFRLRKQLRKHLEEEDCAL